MDVFVARLPECRELFELSGWGDTVWSWYCDEERDDTPVVNLSEPLKVVGGVGHFDHQYPAYDTTFLAKMLPAFELRKFGDGSCEATWTDYTCGKKIGETSRTNASSALCRLAIALFRSGVLLSNETPKTDSK